jgi:uncharacterized protein (DUF2461 family)
MNSTDGLLYGGAHMFSKSMLATFRNAVAEKGFGPEIEQTINAVRQAGDYTVDGDRYKRVPRGIDPDHSMAELLLYKGIWSMSPKLSKQELTSASLIDICEQHAQAMAPLHHAMVKLARMGD